MNETEHSGDETEQICFVCGCPATRTVSSFTDAGFTVDLCDDCEPDRG